MKKLVLFVLVAGAIALAAWYHETEWPVRRASDPPQLLVVEPGTGVREIGARLQGMGYVRHPEVFRAVVVTRGIAGRLRAGEYELSGEMSLSDIVDKLARGDVVRRAVTFPEGSDIDEMAAIVAAKGLSVEEFRKAVADPSAIRDLDPEATDLEGYLFPDTYDLTRRPDEATQLVARMVERFRKVIEPELARIRERGTTVRRVITLASVVELETARPEERPRIAAVFLNRLKKRMPLQTDPTVIYALKKRGTWDGNIRRPDLDVDSPYNTYRFPGLPPGPIASPGREAILAVLQPAAVGDLYFVSRND
ncbi:MAG TPA: endolytic transglycosylase MltG, partial [Vicinamibacteria bacterium]|nr:endolytic transglycosylase MltG [Vicinamibacteria bacterium]